MQLQECKWGEHLLKCGTKNTRLRWDCSQDREHGERASAIFIYYTFNFSVRFALLEEFCFMMAFQILKLRMSTFPLILHAFEANIEIILHHF